MLSKRLDFARNASYSVKMFESGNKYEGYFKDDKFHYQVNKRSPTTS